MRSRFPAIVACAAAVLLFATPAVPVAPASAASFAARLTAPDHSPRAGARNWAITVSARTSSGRALHATAYYEFVYGGQVVSRQYPNPRSGRTPHHPYSFRGSYRDTILWPRRAVGYRLTFRVVVAVRGRGQRNLNWAVRVRP